MFIGYMYVFYFVWIDLVNLNYGGFIIFVKIRWKELEIKIKNNMYIKVIENWRFLKIGV